MFVTNSLNCDGSGKRRSFCVTLVFFNSAAELSNIPPPLALCALMRLDANLKHLFEGAEDVVVVMTGDFLDQFRRPLLAGLRGDFIDSQRPKFRPSFLKFAETPKAIFFALRFECCVVFKLQFEHLHRFAEFRRFDLVAVFALVLLQISQPQLGSCPNRRLEAHSNQLAVDPNSAIVVAVADVLQQAGNFWK